MIYFACVIFAWFELRSYMKHTRKTILANEAITDVPDKDAVQCNARRIYNELTALNDKVFRDHVLDIFFGDESNITRARLQVAFEQHLYFPYHQTAIDADCSSIIASLVDRAAKLINVVAVERVPKRCIQWKTHTVCGWYIPRVFRFAWNVARSHHMSHLLSLGFIRSRGVLIRHTPINPINIDRVCVFVHCSIGGLMIYDDFIYDMCDKFTCVVLIEIPGIAYHTDDLPPTIAELARCIADVVNDSPAQVTLVGHSFGCNVITCLINRNMIAANKIASCLLIEGCVLLPRVFNLYKGFEYTETWRWKSLVDLLSFVIFARSLDIQWYLLRCLHHADSLILGKSEYELAGGVITLFMSADDDRICVSECSSYLINHECASMQQHVMRVFPDHGHSDFIYSKIMREQAMRVISEKIECKRTLLIQ